MLSVVGLGRGRPKLGRTDVPGSVPRCQVRLVAAFRPGMPGVVPAAVQSRGHDVEKLPVSCRRQGCLLMQYCL